MKILIILSLFIFGKISGQQPPDLCKGDKLFRMNDRYCYSFSDLCFKTGDDQCNQILKACEQCPPSNITLTMLRNIWEMSMVQSNLTKEIINKKTPNTFEQFTLTVTNRSKESSTFSNDSCAILLWIIIIILVVHFVETRFKLFTKCFQLCKTNDKYAIVTSRKRKHLNDLETRINQSINNINDLELKINQSLNNTKNDLESKINQSINNINDLESRINQSLNNIINELNKQTAKALTDHINYLKNHLLATPQNNQMIKFSVEGIEHKFIELFVHNNHNIVNIKQRLCVSLVNAKDNDYKRMQLKYNGKILNDNDYLLNYIDSSNNSVNYVINTEIDPSEILVLKLKGKMRLPNIIQIHKNENLENFLSIIGDLIATIKFRVYKCIKNDKYTELSKSNNNGDNKTLNDFGLSDGNVVNVVTIEKGELRLKSIFDENDSFPVTYSNIDQISTFLKNQNNNDLILFDSTENIDENQFIFHFDISSDSQIKFCQFKRYENMKPIGKHIYFGNKMEIYFSTDNENKKILIKKYKIALENLKGKESVLNELKTFLITKSHSRFIQLNNVYKDNESFYISMENMSGGTLNYYLKNNKEFDSTQIFKWAAQILEGLKFLHKNKIVHRDLNPLSILVGDDKSLKLSNFNLSKYNEDGYPCSIIGKDKQLSHTKFRYMAPEILDEKQFDNQCDVWSFGAVLVKIVTGKKPYPKLSKDQAKKKIINSDKIEYNLPIKFDNRIKTFIDSCFSKDPSSRSRIKDLFEVEMIKNSL